MLCGLTQGPSGTDYGNLHTNVSRDGCASKPGEVYFVCDPGQYMKGSKKLQTAVSMAT